MPSNNLLAFFDPVGQTNPYGAMLPNTALPNPTYLGDGNTNFWINNKNWEGSLIAEVWTTLNLEMIRQTEFMHLRFATGAPIIAPRQAGTARVSYNRLRPLNVVINPLKEGELPTKLVGGSEKASATYTHFGAYMQITDVEMEQNPDEMFMKYGADLIRSARESFDIITREFMYKAASYSYANGAATVDEVAEKGVKYIYPKPGDDVWKAKGQRGGQLTFNDIREQQKRMKLLKVKPHPAYGKYIVLVGVDGIDQLRNDGQYKEWNFATDPSMYNNYDHVLVSTDIAIYEIENAKRVKTTDKSAEVGVAFIIGNEAYKEVKLSGSDLQIIVKPKGSAGSADPLDQTATMGWKSTFGLAAIRSEALVALHYALGGDATKTFGTRITWAEDGKGTIKHDAEYTFTTLRDGANFYLSMDDIYDWSVVNPMPYPTDQNTYVEQQKDPNSKATQDYINPGILKALGSLITQLDPAIIEKIGTGEINVVNAINAVAGGGGGKAQINTDKTTVNLTTGGTK